MSNATKMFLFFILFIRVLSPESLFGAGVSFPKKLWKMLEEAHEGSPIRWNECGDAIVVPENLTYSKKRKREDSASEKKTDMVGVSEQLGGCFKSHKLNSFLRQLNYYSFKRKEGGYYNAFFSKEIGEENAIKIIRKVKVYKKKYVGHSSDKAEKESIDETISVSADAPDVTGFLEEPFFDEPEVCKKDNFQQLPNIWEKKFLSSYCEESIVDAFEKTFTVSNYLELIELLKQTNTIWNPYLHLPEKREEFQLQDPKLYRLVIGEDFSDTYECKHLHQYSCRSDDKKNPKRQKIANQCALCQVKKSFSGHLKSLIKLQNEIQKKYLDRPVSDCGLMPHYLESRMSFDTPLVICFIIAKYGGRNYLVAFSGVTPFCSWSSPERFCFTESPTGFEDDQYYKSFPKSDVLNSDLNSLKQHKIMGANHCGGLEVDHIMIENMVEVVGLVACSGFGAKLMGAMERFLVSKKKDEKPLFLCLDSLVSAASFYEKRLGFVHVGAQGLNNKPYLHYMLRMQAIESSSLLMVKKI